MSKTTKSLLLSVIFGIVFMVCLVSLNHKMAEQKHTKAEETKTEVQTEVKEEPKPIVIEESKDIEAEVKKETETKQTATTVTVKKEEPKKEVVETPKEETSSDSNLVSLGTFKLTAYCGCSSCNGQWTGYPTASGVMPTVGRTIAVDPSVIPLGTKVVINGHTYVAEDTGGAIKGSKIDIFFSSHSEAMNFGVKYAEVYVIK